MPRSKKGVGQKQTDIDSDGLRAMLRRKKDELGLWKKNRLAHFSEDPKVRQRIGELISQAVSELRERRKPN